MRGTTVRLKVEQLLERALKTRSHKTLLAMVEVFCGDLLKDRRTRVTDELREKVLTSYYDGSTLAQLEITYKLSSPTLRKIIRGHQEKMETYVDPPRSKNA